MGPIKHPAVPAIKRSASGCRLLAQKQVVAEKFQIFLFLYYVYRGLKGFWSLSDLTLLTPKTAKSLLMGPQNASKQHLRALVL